MTPTVNTPSEGRPNDLDGPAPGPRPAGDPGRVPIWRGLTLRLGLAALLVAIIVGLVGGALELTLELGRERARVSETLRQTVNMVSDSAAEAAYQLNPGVAKQVTDGLAQLATVTFVRIRDDFGGDLALLDRRQPPEAGLRGWVAALFEGVTTREVDLNYVTPTGRTLVGTLSVSLSPAQVGADFRGRALATVASGALRALVISALLAAVVVLLVVRPMLRLTTDIGRVDPSRPGRSLIPAPPGHAKDELGHVAGTLNGLLTAFQHSLDGRDAAERDLRALTADLEARVAQRTSDLEDALAQVAAEKAEAEHAFARLDETHSALEKANRLLVESIGYARRIQTSLLPDKAALNDIVADLHVCWEPLDVVGGDYFWLQRLDPDRGLLLVVDCTGHGVPGAFMTLVVASALDRILHDGAVERPSDLLLRLDSQVRERLRQDHPDSEADSDDGLEAAACIWNRHTRMMTFCGAGLPLFVVEDNRARSIKGDRAYLGYRSLPAPGRLTDHAIPARPGTSFYMLTDGIPDHMGGQPRRLLGQRRLAALLEQGQDRPMAEQLNHLREALRDYRGSEPRRDDMTLIGTKPLPDPPA